MEKKVKELYTQYTYPKYTEYMDKFAPIPHQYCCNLFLEQINHYIYNGSKNNFDNYKILVVGVGLGSDIINMSYLLKTYKNIKLLGIDLSNSSINICKERIGKYNLDNIELIEMSLLDLDPNTHGKFDLIISIGVLHHLENPVDGLNILKNLLEDDGFMSIMVYGKYGRTGIYQMQDLMKKINYNINDYPNKINNFKNIYKQLPQNNWFKKGEHLISDYNESDEGIVDSILHCQDRCYSIPELFNWINKCDLNIIEFSPDTRFKYKFDIENFNYPNNHIDKYSINELFFGDIIKHSFYIGKKTNSNTIAQIDNLNNILILVLITKEALDKILEYYLNNKYEKLNVNCSLTYKLDLEFMWYYSDEQFINLNFEINDIIYTILNNIDNKKTIREIFNIVRINLNISKNDLELLNIFKPVYVKFELYDMILLKLAN